MHSVFITDLVQLDALRRVDIDHDFPVQIVILNSTVPHRVNHEDVLSRLYCDILIQQGEHESVTEPGIDEFSGRGHQDNVEVGRVKLLPLLLQAVLLESIALLKDRDREGVLAEVNLS